MRTSAAFNLCEFRASHDHPGVDEFGKSFCGYRGLDMDGKSVVRAIVFVTDPAEKVRPLPESLQQRYRLTPPESRLALLPADGRTLRQISEMLGVSRNTLKSQLSSIYSKVGTSRQSDLIRMLISGAVRSPTMP